MGMRSSEATPTAHDLFKHWTISFGKQPTEFWPVPIEALAGLIAL
jgi:hypothetical protein